MSDKRIETLVDAIALDEGRVFIGKRRAKRGDVVFLHRDDRFAVVDKPAGIATVPDTRDAHNSLVHRVARELGIRAEAIQVTSRLDRAVSGVVVFALTDAARESLQNARASGAYFRRYVAISARAPEPAEGEWTAPIDGKPSQSRYRVVATSPRGALLHVEPVTGRTHQIRIHASGAHAPLLGDQKYGGSRTLVLPTGKVMPLERIALHCAHVRVEGIIDVRATLPDELRAVWLALGGDAASLD